MKLLAVIVLGQQVARARMTHPISLIIKYSLALVITMNHTICGKPSAVNYFQAVDSVYHALSTAIFFDIINEDLMLKIRQKVFINY